MKSILSHYYPYTIGLDFTPDGLPQFLKDLSTVPSDETIILYRYEQLPIANLEEIKARVNEQDKKIIWVLSEQWYYEYKDRIINLGITVYFLEFNLMNLYFELNVYKSSQINAQWNPDSGKFLFLTGKPDRLNRIGMLYKLYKQGLLDRCVWSLFVDDSIKKNCRKFFPELSYQEYDQFIGSNQRNPDGIEVLFNSGGSCHYDGYPFDHKLFANTTVRLIPETTEVQSDNFPMISEKTWVTIANHQPFVIVANYDNLRYLTAKGYCTFTEYGPYPDYDRTQDVDTRYNQAIDNMLAIVNATSDRQSDINRNVEHNYQNLVNHMETNIKVLEQIHQQLPGDFDLFRIFPIPIQRANWINFYYSARDASWPDCFIESDFKNLPPAIQDECINVFGYRPK
jgi:hypothetical protein